MSLLKKNMLIFHYKWSDIKHNKSFQEVIILQLKWKIKVQFNNSVINMQLVN